MRHFAFPHQSGHDLCIRLGRISAEDRHILNICHKLRCEAFHRGVLRHTILEQIARVLYATVVELTVRLPFRSMILPAPTPAREDADFLNRFGLGEAMSLMTEEGRRLVADRMLAGGAVGPPALLLTLSDDLTERIDAVLGGLETVGETNDRARIDRNLQYTQFWRELGGRLMEQGVREPALEAAYLRWREEGRARYTAFQVAGVGIGQLLGRG
jgi:hypothetical protein